MEEAVDVAGGVAETEKEAESTEEVLEDEEALSEEEIVEFEEEREVEREKKREIEEEIVDENFYTIPLSRAWIYPRKKRAPKAMRILKTFLVKHMKLRTQEDEEAERLVVSNEVNEKIWSRGIEKPPRRIKVRAVKDKEGVVTIYLAEGD